MNGITEYEYIGLTATVVIKVSKYNRTCSIYICFHLNVYLSFLFSLTVDILLRATDIVNFIGPGKYCTIWLLQILLVRKILYYLTCKFYWSRKRLYYLTIVNFTCPGKYCIIWQLWIFHYFTRPTNCLPVMVQGLVTFE